MIIETNLPKKEPDSAIKSEKQEVVESTNAAFSPSNDSNNQKDLSPLLQQDFSGIVLSDTLFPFTDIPAVQPTAVPFEWAKTGFYQDKIQYLKGYVPLFAFQGNPIFAKLYSGQYPDLIEGKILPAAEIYEDVKAHKPKFLTDINRGFEDPITQQRYSKHNYKEKEQYWNKAVKNGEELGLNPLVYAMYLAYCSQTGIKDCKDVTTTKNGFVTIWSVFNWINQEPRQVSRIKKSSDNCARYEEYMETKKVATFDPQTGIEIFIESPQPHFFIKTSYRFEATFEGGQLITESSCLYISTTLHETLKKELFSLYSQLDLIPFSLNKEVTREIMQAAIEGGLAETAQGLVSGEMGPDEIMWLHGQLPEECQITLYQMIFKQCFTSNKLNEMNLLRLFHQLPSENKLLFLNVLARYKTIHAKDQKVAELCHRLLRWFAMQPNPSNGAVLLDRILDLQLDWTLSQLGERTFSNPTAVSAQVELAYIDSANQSQKLFIDKNTTKLLVDAFVQQGKLQKYPSPEEQKNTQNTHIVVRIPLEKLDRNLYVKGFPYQTIETHAYGKLVRALGGGEFSASNTLGKLIIRVSEKEYIVPVQISMGIPGEIPVANPQQKYDTLSLCNHILGAVITRSGDLVSRNIITNPKTSAITIIDNNFWNADKAQPTLFQRITNTSIYQLRILLACTPQVLTTNIPLFWMKLWGLLNIEIIASNWQQAVIEREKAYRSLFSKDFLEQAEKEDDFYLSYYIRPEILWDIFDSLHHLQQASLMSNTEFSLLAFLKKVNSEFALSLEKVLLQPQLTAELRLQRLAGNVGISYTSKEAVRLNLGFDPHSNRQQLEIFGFERNATVLKISQLSKRPQLTINFSSFKTSHNQSNSIRERLYIQYSFPHFNKRAYHTIEILNSNHLSDDDLIPFVKSSAKTLVRLDVRGCKNITGKSIDIALTSCLNLKELFISDTGLVNFGNDSKPKQLNEIETLHLSNSKIREINITGSKLLSLKANNNLQLDKLSLSCVSLIALDLSANDKIKTVSGNFPHVTHLNINECDMDLINFFISSALPLKSLWLKNIRPSVEPDASTITTVLSKFTNLENFSSEGCHNLTCISFGANVADNRLIRLAPPNLPEQIATPSQPLPLAIGLLRPYLKQIKVSKTAIAIDFKDFSPDHEKCICDYLVTSSALHECVSISLINSQFLDDKYILAFKLNSNISELDLTGCSKLSGDFISVLFYRYNFLKKLILNNSGVETIKLIQLQDSQKIQGIEVYANHCQNLRQIQSELFIHRLESCHCPALKSINLRQINYGIFSHCGSLDAVYVFYVFKQLRLNGCHKLDLLNHYPNFSKTKRLIDFEVLRFFTERCASSSQIELPISFSNRFLFVKDREDIRFLKFLIRDMNLHILETLEETMYQAFLSMISIVNLQPEAIQKYLENNSRLVSDFSSRRVSSLNADGNLNWYDSGHYYSGYDIGTNDCQSLLFLGIYSCAIEYLKTFKERRESFSKNGWEAMINFFLTQFRSGNFVNCRTSQPDSKFLEKHCGEYLWLKDDDHWALYEIQSTQILRVFPTEQLIAFLKKTFKDKSDGRIFLYYCQRNLIRINFSDSKIVYIGDTNETVKSQLEKIRNEKKRLQSSLSSKNEYSINLTIRDLTIFLKTIFLYYVEAVIIVSFVNDATVFTSPQTLKKATKPFHDLICSPFLNLEQESYIHIFENYARFKFASSSNPQTSPHFFGGTTPSGYAPSDNLEVNILAVEDFEAMIDRVLFTGVDRKPDDCVISSISFPEISRMKMLLQQGKIVELKQQHGHIVLKSGAHAQKKLPAQKMQFVEPTQGCWIYTRSSLPEDLFFDLPELEKGIFVYEKSMFFDKSKSHVEAWNFVSETAALTYISRLPFFIWCQQSNQLYYANTEGKIAISLTGKSLQNHLNSNLPKQGSYFLSQEALKKHLIPELASLQYLNNYIFSGKYADPQVSDSKYFLHYVNKDLKILEPMRPLSRNSVLHNFLEKKDSFHKFLSSEKKYFITQEEIEKFIIISTPEHIPHCLLPIDMDSPENHLIQEMKEGKSEVELQNNNSIVI